MAEYVNTKQSKGSSGIAKAALALGITGTTAAVLANANNGGGIVNNLLGGAPRAEFANPYVAAAQAFAFAPYAPAACGPCGYVTEKEMTLIRESSGKDAIIAKLEAEKYTDARINESLGPVYAELRRLDNENCDLKAALGMESERRVCGDERLFEYVKGNYIMAEKMINGKDINYHGCQPVIRPVRDCCCEC